MSPFASRNKYAAINNHVEHANGEKIKPIQHVSRSLERCGARRNSKSTSPSRSPFRKSYFPNQTKNLNGQSHFIDLGRKVQVQLSEWNTISACILDKPVECLIDTGASINLIDHDWFMTNLPSLANNLQKPCIDIARAANGSDILITGFVKLSISINNNDFDYVPLNVARDLSQKIILGSKFLKRHGANIDCANSILTLQKMSQLRVLQKQEIPAHTQTILCVKLSNKIPANIIGVCQGGRNITSLGILVANTISSVLGSNCANVLVMNTTNESITLYPRTKLGTFTLIDPDLVHPFDTGDNSDVNLVNSTIHKECVNPNIEEVLSKVNMETDQLTKDQELGLTGLLSEYIDVFQVEGGPRGHYSGIKHEIHTKDHPPIRSRPYRHPPHIQAEIRRQVTEMLDQDIIRESTSPWSFPVCMIPKPGTNTYRFCINFIKLNEISDRNNFPLPNINDTLDSLGAAAPKYFSTLDLASGYWQIDLEENSKPKTAFITQDGLYEFNVMPFGLHNAPATFQRAMQEVLRGLNWKFVLVYLDDVIIFSKSFEEHLDHLKQVLERFRSVGLKLQPKKCTFAQKEVKYLGHIVGQDGVSTDPAKLQIVRNYPIPTKVSEVRSFLGFVGYYRKYIKDFCKISEPLTNLTRKNVHFVWNEKCVEAFETLKQRLLEPPILAYPRFDGTEFILQTDASFKGLGFILAQKHDGKERVISYGGRALHDAEKNYTTTELEALAVVEGIKKYAPYLQHSVKFIVVTDHCALKWLFKGNHSGGRLARWTLKLQAYDFEVIHVRGKNNGNADALSRINYDKLGNCECCTHSHSPKSDDHSNSAWIESNLDAVADDVIQQPQDVHIRPNVNVIRNLRYKHKKRIRNDNATLPQRAPAFPNELDLAKFKQELLTDIFANSMMEYLEHDTLPKDSTKARDIILQSDHYFVHDGLLYHIWHTPAKRHMPERNVVQLYIPKTVIDTVLNNCHDHVLAAHFGFQRTYDRIRQRYFWKGMYQAVDNWVRSCISCAQRKTHRHKVLAPMVNMKVPGAFERVSVDVLGPLPTTVSGNRYVLCFTDHCTRWPILVPLKETDASTIATAFFDHVISEHGCPETLLSDRGANFLSKIVQEVCRIMRTQKLNTSAYHPQCNAIQERYNAVILDTISHYVNQCHSDWDKYLPAIQFAYRTTPATNSVGFSPFFLLYGREARLPLDVTLLKQSHYPEKSLRDHIHVLISQLEMFRDISKTHAEENKSKMKNRYDNRAQEVDFQVGDTVWVYIPRLQKGLSRKLMKFWCGPYLLVERTGPVNFRVRNLENHKLLIPPIHVNRMKYAYDRYIRPNSNEPPGDPDQAEGIPGLVTGDCPADSFKPLLATQEAEKTVTPIILGLPAVQNPAREYEIERIIRGRYKKQRLEYLVKWKFFPNSRNTWEPETNLNKATLDYLVDNPVKITGKM